MNFKKTLSKIKVKSSYTTVNNEELQQRMEQDNINIIDIREPEEYIEGHIPGAESIPLSNLENLIKKLDREKEFYLVCRTGRRVQMSTEIFANNGFMKIVKVIPGMSTWNGVTEKGK